ncbi:MAG TPA: hypothetical protein PKM36_12425, partial [Propionibacteriaceae bacterium]|nr:hypothetical protein [Propionibacteriaceae bacterium]
MATNVAAQAAQGEPELGAADGADDRQVVSPAQVEGEQQPVHRQRNREGEVAGVRPRTESCTCSRSDALMGLTVVHP